MSLNSNNNNKAIRKLAKRSLKVNPFRNTCILITITICTILMILVPVLNSASFQIDLDTVDIQEQAIFQKLNEEQIVQLKNNSKLLCTVLEKSGPAIRVNDSFVRLGYTEYSERDIIPYRLLEGNLPEKRNEVVSEKKVMEQLGLSIGDSIVLNVAENEEETFVICGMSETIGDEDSIPKLYVSQSYAEEGIFLKQRPYQMRVKLQQKNGMSKADVVQTLLEIAEDVNIDSDYVNVNTMYLYSMHFTAEQIFFYAFIDLSILLAGILVIYSVFYISVISRIPLFGQLSTIGMSRRQIKRFVNEEGLRLSILGTAFGVIGSGIFSYILITAYWNFNIFLGVSVVVSIMTMLIIMLSIQKPVSMAANISPIEAVRYDLINGKRNKLILKTHKVTPRSIASIRFRRDRKKVLFTMLSLIVGGILFFVSAIYICSIDVETFARNGYFRNYEYIITFATIGEDLYYDNVDLTDMQKQKLFTKDLVEELEQIPEVESVERRRGTIVSFDIEGYIVNEDVSVINKGRFEQEVLPHLLDQTLTYEQLVQQKGIIYTRNEDTELVYGEGFSAGDSVKLEYYNGTENDTEEVVMAGFTDREYLADHFIEGGILIPEEIMELMMPGIDMTEELYVNTVDEVYSKELDEVVSTVVKKHPLLSVMTFYEQVQERSRQLQLIQQILVVISIFGMLFSVINMLNTTLTTMITRDKELALLEAIGMQEKQMKKMLLYESLYLTLPSIVISIILGTVLGYLTVSFMGVSQATMTYQLPLWIVGIYTISMIVMPLCLSYYLYHRLSKKTIMERLKMDE